MFILLPRLINIFAAEGLNFEKLNISERERERERGGGGGDARSVGQ